MCNLISFPWSILSSRETWQILLVILFFSLLFTVFLVAACWIKLFCHIQEVLAGCSWGGSMDHTLSFASTLAPDQLFFHKKSKSYHLPFAFTFALLQKKLHVPWPKVLAWTRLLFFIKITLSAAIIDMKPKENSSV